MSYLVICDDLYLAQINLREKNKNKNIVWVNYDENTNLSQYLSTGLFNNNSNEIIAIINPAFLYKEFDLNSSKALINTINNSSKQVFLIVDSKYDYKKTDLLKIDGKNEIKSLDSKNNSKFNFITKELDKLNKNYPNWLPYFIDKNTNNDARLICSEIKKLEFVDEESLNNREEIDKIIIDHSDTLIYNLAKEIINNNVQEILNIYQDLIDNKRQPSEIISTLITMLSKIYFLLLGKKMKLSDEDIAKKMGVNIYWLKYTYRDIYVKSDKVIKDFIVDLLKLDINNKRSLADPYQSLKYFIIRGID
ncbi:DNA polymerase III subunit delta [Mycoplasma sp. T363T]|uniref:DNA polymerase III subunit delta n=1 Tax=Mycoplasma bradburyae TaxID=2963128 RepID=A0AAW6HR90_9MOLU|nr:DNA polymerase III subunit delta [Mycoplasma bradburyae]MDC4163014.1 DNA polymerase III subunit delta [Mycoplasma bradburyae]MDC4181625.1 DNA polymerase III subunit delta [Mycoplasma bradburyae]MDC4183078.1 DNA polymerase III subunit delta [Mycoplasma bradburyae]UTS69953.1 DNA polymerase III subunit delta [Mycoplasma bradburyae]UTS70686.1 DNA polymerase III subunit delta [Mycoplasma bradburyae]